MTNEEENVFYGALTVVKSLKSTLIRDDVLRLAGVARPQNADIVVRLNRLDTFLRECGMDSLEEALFEFEKQEITYSNENRPD